MTWKEAKWDDGLSPEPEKSLVFLVEPTHMDEISYLKILPYGHHETQGVGI